MSAATDAGKRIDDAFCALPGDCIAALFRIAIGAYPIIRAQADALKHLDSMGGPLFELVSVAATRLIGGKERALKVLTDAYEAAPELRSFVAAITLTVEPGEEPRRAVG